MEAKKIIAAIGKIGIFVGAIGGMAYFNKKTFNEMKEKYNKQSAYYSLTQQWLLNKHENKELSEYLENYGYKKIAVYGMGTLSELFYHEIRDKEIKVKYFIDKNADEIYCGMDDIPVVNLKEINMEEEIDAIIVTPVFNFEEIERDLEELGVTTAVVSLEDIVYGI